MNLDDYMQKISAAKSGIDHAAALRFLAAELETGTVSATVALAMSHVNYADAGQSHHDLHLRLSPVAAKADA